MEKDIEAKNSIMPIGRAHIWKSILSRIFSEYADRAKTESGTILKTDLWNEIVDKNKDFTEDMNNTFSPESIIYVEKNEEFCKKFLCDKNCEVVNSSISDIPLNSESIDLILDISTSDHLEEEDFKRAISEYSRILKLNKHMIVLHNSYNYIPFYFVRKYLKKFDIYPRKAESIEEILIENKFDILDKKYAFFMANEFVPDSILQFVSKFGCMKSLISRIDLVLGNKYFSRNVCYLCKKID